jgi:hypothetical protein
MGRYVPKSLRDDYRLSIEEEVVEADVVEDTKTVEVEVNPEPDATKVEVEVDPTPDVEVTDDTELEEAQDKVEEVSENIAEASDVLNRATDMQGNVEEALDSDNKDNVAIVAGMATEALRDVRSKLGLSSSSVSVEDISKDPYASLRLSKEGLSDVIEKIIAGIKALFKKLWDFIKSFVKTILTTLGILKTDTQKAERLSKEILDVMKANKIEPYSLKDNSNPIQTVEAELDKPANFSNWMPKTGEYVDSLEEVLRIFDASSKAFKDGEGKVISAIEGLANANKSEDESALQDANAALVQAIDNFIGSSVWIPVISSPDTDANSKTFKVDTHVANIQMVNNDPSTAYIVNPLDNPNEGADDNGKITNSVEFDLINMAGMTYRDLYLANNTVAIAGDSMLKAIPLHVAKYEKARAAVDELDKGTEVISNVIDNILKALEKNRNDLPINAVKLVSNVATLASAEIKGNADIAKVLIKAYDSVTKGALKYIDISKIYVDAVKQ